MSNSSPETIYFQSNEGLPPKKYGAAVEGVEMKKDPREVREQFWTEMIAHPEQLIASDEVIYVAGGGMAEQMANDKSEIWQAIVAQLHKNKNVDNQYEVITFAGSKFDLKRLTMLGNFYRTLKEQGKILKCIDERLDSNQAHHSEVHQKCGMCGGVQGAIDAEILNQFGINSVEDQLLKEVHPDAGEQKQGLIKGTESNHQSLSIMISFGNQHRTISPEKVESALGGALPFNVSFPVDQIERFIRVGNLSESETESFLDSLIDWSPVIAKAIIVGHNDFAQFAEDTQVIFDETGVEKSPILEKLQTKIKAKLNLADENIRLLNAA